MHPAPDCPGLVAEIPMECPWAFQVASDVCSTRLRSSVTLKKKAGCSGLNDVLATTRPVSKRD